MDLKNVRKIGRTECYNVLQQYSTLTLFIDTRGYSEYIRSHIRNSINIHFSNIEDIDHLDPQCPQMRDFSRFKNRNIYKRFLLYGDQEVINSLISKTLGKTKKDIVVLDDYSSFQKKYPFLIVEPKKKPIPNELPTEIIEDFLFLGSRNHGTSLKILNALNITHVINVAVELVARTEGMEYCDIEGIFDTPNESLSKVLDKSISFIEEVRKRGNGKVIVHCNLGVSRSSSVVIAYLMKSRNMSFGEAFRYVKSRRPIIRPNPGFERQLRKLLFKE